ncbi:MAG: hypothetical protein JJU02_05555 [Cryomorphaceae bacterium]|nr:hypothetical protein [Cryomorphaceae bacterium]
MSEKLRNIAIRHCRRCRVFLPFDTSCKNVCDNYFPTIKDFTNEHATIIEATDEVNSHVAITSAPKVCETEKRATASKNNARRKSRKRNNRALPKHIRRNRISNA